MPTRYIDVTHSQKRFVDPRRPNAKISFYPCMPPSKFWGTNGIWSFRTLLEPILTVRDSTFLTKPELNNTSEKLYSVTHYLNSSIVLESAIFDTAPAFLMGNDDTKAPLARYRSSIQDAVEDIFEYPHPKRAQRLPCLDWYVVRPYRFQILHAANTIT